MRVRGLYRAAMLVACMAFGGVQSLAADPVAIDTGASLAAMVPLPRAPQPSTPEDGYTARLATVLNPADIERYREIFTAQVAGDWDEADALIANLDDGVLLGHVLAQRYLHPTAYRSRYDELRDWLTAYADLPDAGAIHKLALQRRPAQQKGPAAPRYSVSGIAPANYADTATGDGRARGGLSAADRQAGERAIARVHNFLRQGATLSAKELLQDMDVQRLMSAPALDWARARLATGYFTDGHDDWALEWATLAARSAKQVPEAHWTAGLAAWRLDRLAEAAKHFEALARRNDLSPSLVSASAFWAARAHLRSGEPRKVSPLLERAAEQTRTFYGILARRLLGLPLEARWAGRDDVAALSLRVAAQPAGRRGLALLQVGQKDRAAAEFLGLVGKTDIETARGVLVIAGRSGVPALAMKLDSMLYPDGVGFDGGAYPLPAWTPEGGFRIDRALIYALIHQESRFNPGARSPAGASGLMQLMPATANWIVGSEVARGDLLDPVYNLELGQRYIELLLAEGDVGGDLLRMLVAWNGGPGNLAKWLRNTKHQDDPLLFIETITRRETRMFAEKVLSNFWLYRDRLGQTTPSLDDIAAGRWPTYEPQDRADTELAENAPRRH